MGKKGSNAVHSLSIVTETYDHLLPDHVWNCDLRVLLEHVAHQAIASNILNTLSRKKKYGDHSVLNIYDGLHFQPEKKIISNLYNI